MIYRFDRFELDDERLLLRAGGESVAIQPRAFEVLCYLVRHRDRVVTKDELLDRFWPDVAVEPNALNRALHLARKAVGDDARSQSVIKTVSRVGFHFVARVDERETPSPNRADALIGRADVLDALESDFAHAAAGAGRAIWIEGEAGVGKTRLAQELIARASESGARVWTGRCLPNQGAPPWWPWVQLVRQAVRSAPAEDPFTLLGEGAPVLANLLPSLRTRMPDLPAAPKLDAASARFQVLDALSCFLHASAARGPLVVLFDDLHWADRSSLRALAHCVPELSTLPVLLIGTYRREDLVEGHGLPEVLAASSRAPDDRTVVLSGLSQDETGALARATTGRELGGEDVAALWQRTGGNPLFVRQLVQMLDDEGALGRDALAERLGGDVPPAMRGVIESRLAQTSDACRQLLMQAAIIGPEFELDLLESIWRGDRAALSDALEEAHRRGLIRPTGEARLRFSHGLIQQSLRDAATPSDRAGLEARIAEALEKHRAESLDSVAGELATRFLTAARSGGEAARAVYWATRATDVAMQRLAWDEAVQHAERALEAAALDDVLPPGRQAELWCALGDASNRAGGVARAREAFERAAALASTAGDPTLLARAALGLGQELLPFETGVTDDVQVGVLRDALSQISSNEPALRSRLLGRLGLVSAWSGGRDEELAHAEEAVALAREADDPLALSFALGALYVNRDRLRGRPEQIALTDELVDAADSGRDAHQAIWARHLRIIEAMKLGRLDLVHRDVEDMETRARAMRLPVAQSRALSIRAGLVLMEADLARGEAMAIESLGLGSAGDPVNSMQAFGAHMLYIRLEQGRAGELEGQVRGLIEQLPDMGVWHSALAMMLVETGRRDEARASLHRALEDGFASIDQPTTGSSATGTTAQVCAQLWDTTAAEALAAPLAGLHELQAAGPVGYYGPFALFSGMAQAVLGDFDEAERAMQQGEREAVAMGAWPYVVRARLERARWRLMRARPGDEAEAREIAEAEIAPADERGLSMLAERARQLAAGRPDA